MSPHAASQPQDPRTRQNKLNRYMHKKFWLVSSPLCNCDDDEQTTEHALQSCKLLEAIRKEVWPVPTSLVAKLYRTREELAKQPSLSTKLDCGCSNEAFEGRKDTSFIFNA